MKFGYRSRRTMDPRPGNQFATIYYKQSASERERTFQHVRKVILEIGEAALAADGGMSLEQPLAKFPRQNRTDHYSALDIMNDMYHQMQSGKDIASGILGRWNRWFDGTGLEIDMVLESELPANNRFDDFLKPGK